MKIVICDRDASSRENIKILVSKINDIEIVAEFKAIEDFVSNLKRKIPDIIIYNLQTNKIDDISGIQKILIRCKGIKVIVYSSFEDFRTIAVSFSAGAIAFLAKRDLSVSELSNAINYSKNNYHYFSKCCEYKMGSLYKMIQLNCS